MKRATYLRVAIASITAALVLSVISLLCLIKFSDMAFSEHRKSFLQFMAHAVESSADGLSLPIGPFGPPRGGPGGPPPPPPMWGKGPHPGFPPPPGPPMGPPPMGRPPGPGGEFPEFWVVSEKGEILSGNKQKSLPAEFATMKKPTVVHGITNTDSLWNFFDRTIVLKLDHEPTAYLVLLEKRNPFKGPLFVTQGIFTFGTVVVALFLALGITFFYLRKKSEEARNVLLRLERGELEARFEIKPFDEFGGLLLDFNRMAHEIERLVNRLRETESARSNLLSELGHDLRTPLTSLTTAFETLKFHFNKMTPSDRNEVFTMITAEVEYFKELLEKLMTIAELDEPHYKKSTDVIDLNLLVQQEIRHRQSSPNGKTDWSCSAQDLKDERALVLGDSYLMLRLLKNALDNASRYAKNKVHVAVMDRHGHIEITVTDDGPGMDANSMNNFGKRQERRKRREEGAGLNFSLGLGSVIMKTIAELHGGRLQVENLHTDAGRIDGMILRVQIPRAQD